MELFQNPFFILGATTRDKRSQINKLAEEKSLLMNSEDCGQARNILTNPSKRLSAEVAWFPGQSQKTIDSILKYLVCIKNGKEDKLHVDVYKINPVARLNVLTEMLRYREFVKHSDIIGKSYTKKELEELNELKKSLNEYSGLASLIIEVDKCFEQIDPAEVMLFINEERLISGFPLIENLSFIEDELKPVRQEIRRLIEETFSQMPQDSYIKVVNTIAEKYINDKSTKTGAVIDDIFDSYKLNTKDLIEKQAIDLIAMTENIKSETGEAELNFMVDYLIKQIENFDRLAQPLQLKARADGTEHKESEQVAWAVRGLAIDLHNNHNATGQSIKLTDCLKITFAELDEFTEKTQEDIEILNDIHQNQQAEKAEYNKMIVENLSDREYSVTVSGERFAIPPFCTCCMTPTDNREKINGSISETRGRKQRTRTVTLDFPICVNCQKHRKQISYRIWMISMLTIIISFSAFWALCYTDVDYNTLVAIYVVITTVIYSAFGYFIKLPFISPEHSTWEASVRIKPVSMSGKGIVFDFTNWRYANMFADANKVKCTATKNRSRVKNNRLISAIAHPISVYIGIIVITVIVSVFVGPSIYRTLSSSPNAGVSAPTSTDNTPSVYQQRNSMENDLEMKKSEIESMEADLSSMETDLNYYKTMFEDTSDNYYVDEYNSILDEYHSLYDDYDSAINEYNGLVADYNAKYAQ